MSWWKSTPIFTLAEVLLCCIYSLTIFWTCKEETKRREKGWEVAVRTSEPATFRNGDQHYPTRTTLRLALSSDISIQWQIRSLGMENTLEIHKSRFSYMYTSCYHCITRWALSKELYPYLPVLKLKTEAHFDHTVLYLAVTKTHITEVHEHPT